MADRFSVEPQTTSYGAVTGVRGLQAELMRRLQMEEAVKAEQQRSEQLAFERQRLMAGDKRQAELDALNKRVAIENLESNVEARKAAAEARKLAGQKTEADVLTKQLKVGQTLTEAQAAQFAANPLLAGLKLTVPGKKAAPAQTVIMPPAEGEETESEVPLAPATEATPDTAQYAGTPEQQKVVQREAEDKAILAGKLREDPRYGKDEVYTRRADYLETAAQLRASGEDQLPAASLLAPPKSAVEGKAQHDLKMQDLESRIATGYKASPEETANLKTWQSRNPTYAQQEAGRTTRIVLSGNQTTTRQETARTATVRNAEYNKVVKDYEDARPIISKAQSLMTGLQNSGGVMDFLAVPQFIGMVAGGYGSGLRMSDYEINFVLGSKSAFQKLELATKNWFDITPAALTPQQRADMVKMATYLAQREATRGARALEIADEIADPDVTKTPEEIRKKRLEHMEFELRNLTGGPNAGAKNAPKKSGEFFNPATGKLEKR